MSVDNNHFKNREIQALRQEEPRADAKAELILALLKPKRESQMSILRKATLPTLVSVAAIAGVFYVAQPRVLATPDRVIKAIQDIKNYTINSFTIDGKTRHLQSKTTVTGKERKTVYYDVSGKEVEGRNASAFVMMHDSPMKMGFAIDSTGNLKDMSKEDIEKIKGSIHIVKSGDGNATFHTEGDSAHNMVKIEVTKGPDGKEVKHYYVNGKEVDKLPAGMEGKVHILQGGSGSDGKNEVRVEVKKGANGEEEKHIFVNGKEVDKLPSDVNVVVNGGTAIAKGNQEVKVQVTKGPDGKEVKHFYVNGKEVDKLPAGIEGHTNMVLSDGTIKGIKGQQGVVMINAESMKNGKGGSISKSMAVVGGKNGEKPMVVQSGQTSADYLVNLLKDTSRWTIEHGVELNGQKLDKFTLKGPISPIVLFVDPATALPKVLRFGTPMKEGVTIEDVYEYNIQP
jgi:hypothetical protein